jgi:uracil phosphoribosyltransferase
MTTTKTLKTLRKAFKDFEEVYVGMETVCRESEAITPMQNETTMTLLRAAYGGMRGVLAEVERAKAMEDAA